MNRLMAEAVIARAEQGQRVLVLDRDMRDVAAHFDLTHENASIRLLRLERLQLIGSRLILRRRNGGREKRYFPNTPSTRTR